VAHQIANPSWMDMKSDFFGIEWTGDWAIIVLRNLHYLISLFSIFHLIAQRPKFISESISFTSIFSEFGLSTLMW
jgi:hypothetical protein